MGKIRLLEILLSKISPKFIFRSIEFLRILNKTYSEFGEDITIEYIIIKLNIDDFSYIDVGCHRPISGSNTYKFYKRGKRGTAVDANKHMEKLWRLHRKEDIFLNKACSTAKNPIEFYVFDDLASSNTTSLTFAENIKRKTQATTWKTVQVQTTTLQEIIAYHKKNHFGEFFLTIDVEGIDDEIIQAWFPHSHERPFCVVIEDNFLTQTLLHSAITTKMTELEYIFVARGPLSSFFVDKYKINVQEWTRLKN